MHKLAFILLLTICVVSSGCCWIPVYRPQIQQGNVVTDEMVDKLRLGMDEQQVRFIMGNPVLTNIFSTNHWDYVYTLQKCGKMQLQKRISLTFCNGKLECISPDV